MNVGKALKRETVFTQLPSGMYEVSLDYFPYFPIMDNCKVEATRQLMEKAFNCKCKDTNTQILTKLCQLRQEKAKILDYTDHATFVLGAKIERLFCAILYYSKEDNFTKTGSGQALKNPENKRCVLCRDTHGEVTAQGDAVPDRAVEESRPSPRCRDEGNAPVQDRREGCAGRGE